MQTIKNNIFLETVLVNTPRLLGQLNRNSLSLSYGSFDRAYWHYRTNDISSARYQEAILTLALLYVNNFEGNIYYNNRYILELINASFNFTLSIQNKDGSFNEWYTNERSYVCTSFISVALSEALIILGKNNVKRYDEVLKMLDKAASWIKQHTEELVFNQLAGSVLALANISKLTNNDAYQKAVRQKFAIIKKNQSVEGWWSEYGGPDVGYLSLMIDYLAKYYKIEQREEILSVVKKATVFLIHFLHPNLTAGGEYMSRNTEYIIPSGLAYLSGIDKNAKIITAFNINSLKSGAGIGPNNLDDRYLCYILYNWLQAGIFLNQNNIETDIDIGKYLAERRIDRFFAQAGLRVIQNNSYYLVINLYKGGAFRLYTKKGEYLDSGIEIKYKGQRFISNVLDYTNEIKNKTDLAGVKGILKPVQEPLMKTLTMILFKLFQLTLGRAGKLQIFLKSFLRKKMITRQSKNSAGILFKRDFTLADNNIAVKDSVNVQIPAEDFSCGLKASYNFIPSSKYFATQEAGNKSNTVEKQHFSTTEEGSSWQCIFV